uniref:Uncharacterized protein n=1 Tax=Anguilla anguilla TaxID=7936 RepID=A0A0E9R4E3_ANGAN
MIWETAPPSGHTSQTTYKTSCTAIDVGKHDWLGGHHCTNIPSKQVYEDKPSSGL